MNKMSRFSRGLKRLERWLLVAGVICLSVFAAAMIHRSVSSRAALAEFEQMKARAAERIRSRLWNSAMKGKSISLWSEKRVRAYQESLATLKRAPMAVLTVGRLASGCRSSRARMSWR